MQIITRSANEGIILDKSILVSVVEIQDDEVTLEISGPDGQTQRVTLPCLWSEEGEEANAERELVLC